VGAVYAAVIQMLGNGDLTICPCCVAEKRNRKSELSLVRAGVAPCQFHGEMELMEAFYRTFGPERSETSALKESRS